MLTILILASFVGAFANCPSPYHNDSCNSECSIISSGVSSQDWLNCDFTDESGGVEVHAVTDYDGTYGSINYSVFGETPSGGEFCCWFDDPDGEIVMVWLEGTDDADFMECNWADEDLYYFNDGQDSAALVCRIDGHADEDLLTGSNDDSGSLSILFGCLAGECDFISGMGNVDGIWGYDGPDWLAGGAMGDEIRGGAGNDILWTTRCVVVAEPATSSRGKGTPTSCGFRLGRHTPPGNRTARTTAGTMGPDSAHGQVLTATIASAPRR